MVIVQFPDFLKDPMSVLGSEGFVVYGGIITGVLAAMIYCRIKHLKFLEYFDLLAPSVALAQGFGRIGCFLAGCCYGRETNAFWGITFPEGSLAPAGVKSILSSYCLLPEISLLCSFYWHTANTTKKPEMLVFSLYMLLYGVGRFLGVSPF